MDFAKTLSMTAAGTICSRMLGFARDAAIAWTLGAGPLADVFLAALRLPDIARRTLGDGTLSLSLAAACRASGSPAGLGLAVTRRLAVAVAMAAACAMAGAPWLAALIAPGLPRDETAFFLFLTLPYVPCAAVAAGGMAVLQATNRFLVPSISPTVLNACILLAAAWAWSRAIPPRDAAVLLACGLLAGGVVQAAIHVLPARGIRHGEPPVRAGEAAAVAASAPCGLLLSVTPQLTLALACVAASTLPSGHVAALFYAERLVEFPLGVTAAALGMASVPALADRGDAAATERRLAAAVTLALCLSIPAAAGLAAVGAPLIGVLLRHGAFDAGSAELTTNLLYALLPAIPLYAATRPLLTVCIARGGIRHLLQAGVAVGVGIGTGVGLADCGLSVGPAIGAVAGLCTQAAVLLLTVGRQCAAAIGWDHVGLCASASLAVYGVAAVVGAGTRPWAGEPGSILCAVTASVAVFALIAWPARDSMLAYMRMLNADAPKPGRAASPGEASRQA